MLVVAHRLSTVEKADNIIVIEQGRVAEQGSHSQLMAGGGLYSKLVQKQLLGIDDRMEVLNPCQEPGLGEARERRRRSNSSGSGSGSASELESILR